MIKSETITARIKNRILVTDAPIFSGEAVRIKLDFDCGEAVAANHKIVLFGVDKTALAEGTFTATESAWIADLNTATREMAAYFADVPVDATKTIGAMVIDTIKSDVITRGNVLVVSTPFPDDLAPCPQTYSYLTTEEFSSSMAAVESEISGKADASDFVQLSNTVADLSSAMASKAESSTVADLAEDMRSLVQSLSDLDTNKADADIVDDLAAEVDATEKRREVFGAETIPEKVNVTSPDIAAKWLYLWSDSPRDACLMRIYYDEESIETGDNSTMRQFYITFAHLPNRNEIQYTNDGPNGYYENIFGLVSEYNTNFQPPSAEGFYTYRFSFCPAADLYFAELLAYRPL